jgi:release factor glutamine methyltransferase
MNNTLIKVFEEAKRKFNTNNTAVLYELLFYVSKKVKNLDQFNQNRNNVIDFDKNEYFKLLKQYFINNKPLTSIVNSCKFMGVNIKVVRGVLTPRNETELLVENAINLLKKDKSLIKGIDFCSGSGNIALAIKKHCPWIEMHALDINNKAINNIKQNAKLNNLEIKIHKADLFKFLNLTKLKFDFIISNPPYVEKDHLDPKMLQFEDKRNFVYGQNSTIFYKKILKKHKKILNEKFLIFFEIGFNQKKTLISLALENNLTNFYFIKDYAKNDRILIIKSKK